VEKEVENKNHSKKISTSNNFDINSTKKIKQEKEKAIKHLKKTKYLQKKIATKPFLYKFAKFAYRNYISTIGSTHILPDFIICAAPRSGTTSIYEGLLEHPNIFSAKIKEIYFFDGNYHRGENWYRYYFPSKLKKLIYKKILKKKFVTGEASPIYLINPHAPHRIQKTSSKVKLILILRNPIDRAHSHYNSAVRNKKEKLSFEDAIKEEKNRVRGEMEKMINDENYYSGEIYNRKAYFLQGLYYNDLKRWMKIFPRKQFLIINSEEFFKDPTDNFNKIYEFLELPRINHKYVHYNLGKYPPMKDETRRLLIEYYKPYNEKLYKLIGKSFDWDK